MQKTLDLLILQFEQSIDELRNYLILNEPNQRRKRQIQMMPMRDVMRLAKKWNKENGK